MEEDDYTFSKMVSKVVLRVSQIEGCKPEDISEIIKIMSSFNAHIDELMDEAIEKMKLIK